MESDGFHVDDNNNDDNIVDFNTSMGSLENSNEIGMLLPDPLFEPISALEVCPMDENFGLSNPAAESLDNSSNTNEVKKRLFAAVSMEPTFPLLSPQDRILSPSTSSNNPINRFRESKRPRLLAEFTDVENNKTYIDLCPLNSIFRESRKNVMENRQVPTHSLQPHIQKTYHTVKMFRNEPQIIDISSTITLPIIRGKHVDLATISPKTVASLFSKENKKKFIIFDCRYPYEFKGGHIMDAVNTYLKEHVVEELFCGRDPKRTGTIVIFHCEFSSRRGPSMYRFMRKKDLELTKKIYPYISYPEMYLMEGGYKAFFNSYRELCVPRSYVEMRDKNHINELRYFRCSMKLLTDEYFKKKHVIQEIRFTVR